jgi:hypothetical protein
MLAPLTTDESRSKIWAMRESNPSTQPLYGASQLRQDHQTGAAKSGAVGSNDTLIDPCLAIVIRAWARLPVPDRNAIVAIVDGAANGPGNVQDATGRDQI